MSTPIHFKSIERGDIVRSKFSHESFVVVDGNSTRGFTLVKTITMTNPFEWAWFDKETGEIHDILPDPTQSNG